MNDKKIMSVLIAMFLAISALTAVSGDGSDPNDPTDGGADWDGDGLTKAEEQAERTNMNNADSDGDGPVSYTHLRAHETDSTFVCRLLLEKNTTKFPVAALSALSLLDAVL